MSPAVPRISVIVPAYNAESSLGACIESIYAQAHSCIEVVCVNDGSTDTTHEIMLALKDKHPDMQVLSQDHAGAPRARNTGARMATGEYVFFCDADISLSPDALSRLCDALERHPDAVFAYGDYVFHDGTMMRAPRDYRAVLKRPCISTMSLVRRSRFPGFDEALTRFQDWDLWLTIVQSGGRGLYVGGAPLFSTLMRGTISVRIAHIWFFWPLRSIARKYHAGMQAYERAATIIRHKHHLV